MFVVFKKVISSTRVRVPFGIAQQGKAFRNEITPGNFVFRVREFELMEMEYFVRPRQDDEAFDYWRKERMRWYTDVLGINRERLRMYDHPQESLSHYSKQTTDIEYEFPFGWGELEGIDVAQEVVKSLRGQFRVEYDQTGGNIGRRYRRQDEIGTPFCITVDFETLNDKAVTIRHRDSTEQERLAIADLLGELAAKIG